MISDPYSVLGVNPKTPPEEIKKAYRNLAKKYHPDLHPDDPYAAERMNEINIAYDMIVEAEKSGTGSASAYSGGAASAQAGASSAYGSKYGYNNAGSSAAGGRTAGYGSSARNSYGAGYGQARYNGGYKEYQRSTQNGRTSFGFEDDDMFGFGKFTHSAAMPTVDEKDPPYVAEAIEKMNRGMYEEALACLANILSSQRNARWHYLNAVAYYGNDDIMKAIQYIDIAIMMDENAQDYRALKHMIQFQTASNYSSTADLSIFGGGVPKSIGIIVVVLVVLTYLKMIF